MAFKINPECNFCLVCENPGHACNDCILRDYDDMGIKCKICWTNYENQVKMGFIKNYQT